MPGATNFELSFSRLRRTIPVGLVEMASKACVSSNPNKKAIDAKSRGIRNRCSSLTPLEITTGTWNSSAIATSRRRLESNLTRAGPSKISSDFISTSNLRDCNWQVRLRRGQKTVYDSRGLENLKGQRVCLWQLGVQPLCCRKLCI